MTRALCGLLFCIHLGHYVDDKPTPGRRGRELCCVITLNEEKIKLKLFLGSHTFVALSGAIYGLRYRTPSRRVQSSHNATSGPVPVLLCTLKPNAWPRKLKLPS
jgi:hypothetical protein